MTEPDGKTRLIVPLVQPEPTEMRSARAAAAKAGADLVELRLDCLADGAGDALSSLLSDSPVPTLATCRTRAEGGRFAGSDAEAIELLTRAAEAGADWVDLEFRLLAGADALRQAIAARTSRPGLILSHHDWQQRPGDLPGLMGRMHQAGADVAKVAFAPAGPEDAWACFDALASAEGPAIALAMGEAGLPSRVLARAAGAWGTFASLAEGAESAPGQVTIEQMRTLYRWDAQTAATAFFGVVGCPVGHSMSPAIHNEAFAADGVDGVYVPLLVQPEQACFDRFLDAALAGPQPRLRGLSVTIPHKRHALARVGADGVDPLSRAIGAINTVAVDPGAPPTLRGCNTDYAGAIDALVEAIGCEREDLAGRSVAVLGAGGAARAIVAAVSHYGARTTVYNRTISRAEALAGQFDRPAGPVAAGGLDALEAASAEIVVNCTPIGMHPKVDADPLPESFRLSAGTVVFDTIYNPMTTRLLARAESAGCVTVSGLAMFVNQAAAQYEYWLNRPAPRDLMRQVVLEHLTG